MEYRAVTLHLPESLLSAAEAAAHGEEMSVAQWMREALVGRIGSASDPDPRHHHRVLSLRARLAPLFDTARTWSDLETRLRSKGYLLRHSEDGLMLATCPAGQILCQTSELGFGTAQLMRKFGAAHPAALQSPAGTVDSTARHDSTDAFEVIDRADHGSGTPNHH